MATLREPLGEGEQQHFMRLTGLHPGHVGVKTHGDAISYLNVLDAHRMFRGRKAPKPGLLGMVAPRLAPAQGPELPMSKSAKFI